MNHGHIWMLNEYGAIDRFATEYDSHNGPRCVVCGYGFCHHCKQEKDIIPCKCTGLNASVAETVLKYDFARMREVAPDKKEAFSLFLSGLACPVIEELAPEQQDFFYMCDWNDFCKEQNK